VAIEWFMAGGVIGISATKRIHLVMVIAAVVMTIVAVTSLIFRPEPERSTIQMPSETEQQISPNDEVTLYVATDGNDQWSGTLSAANAAGTDGPLATLVGARDAIRRMKEDGPLQQPTTVQLRGGVYQLSEPFTLTPQDSGAEQAPITYAAYPGEQPVISGGREINGWRKGEGELWTVAIPEIKAGNWYFRQLFVNGERRVRARLPREGFYETTGCAPKKERKHGNKPKYIKVAAADLAQWGKLDDAELVYFHIWDESRWPIKEVDEEKGIVTFATFSPPADDEHGRYYMENLPEGLTGPGQWYLDRATGVLSYWPLPDEDMTQAQVVAPVIEQLVRLAGNPDAPEFVEHVAFRGLTFTHSAWTIPDEGYHARQAEASLGAAISADGAHNCSIEDCEIAHIGLYAIDLERGCQRNRIAGCRIHDIGAGGIKIGEGQVREQAVEQTANNMVTDNYIYDLGHVFLCGVGILVRQSSANIVAHNEIRDLNYTGISVGWTWGYKTSLAGGNIIEYNHIYNIGRGLLSDMGGIYTLGIQPGTVLRYNLIHDVESYDYGGWGLYTDEGSTDILLEKNVVYNTKSGGFHQHYGRENIIRNNIFAFSRAEQIIRSREERHISFVFERNIVYFDNGKLLGTTWKNSKFRFDNNLYWDTSGTPLDFAEKSWSEWQQSGQDIHSLVADPLFVDAANHDFRLKPESPALKLGFEPIDLSDVGPRVKTQAKETPNVD